MTLQEMLARIVELAQAEVVCHQCGGTGVWRQYDSGGGLLPPGAKHICKVCHGTGKVPAPRYANLVEALAEYCPKDKYPEREWHKRARMDSRFLPLCCHGTHRVLRSWDGLPQGALAGAELLALYRIAEADPQGSKWAFDVAQEFHLNGGWHTEDPDATLTHAILAAMEKEATQCH